MVGTRKKNSHNDTSCISSYYLVEPQILPQILTQCPWGFLMCRLAIWISAEVHNTLIMVEEEKLCGCHIRVGSKLHVHVHLRLETFLKVNVTWTSQLKSITKISIHTAQFIKLSLKAAMGLIVGSSESVPQSPCGPHNCTHF